MKADGPDCGTVPGPTPDAKDTTEEQRFGTHHFKELFLHQNRKNVLEKFEKVWGYWDKLFLKHLNREFGENLELACRAACFTVICGLPFILPKWICPMCDHVLYTRFYNSGSVTYFLFTLYKTTGETIYFASGGVMGTIFATLTIWLLNGFMPGGYLLDGPDHVWWIANVVGAVYVFLLLYLNFDSNTKVFGISTYVWHWMAYINPHTNAGFAGNFAVKVDGAAISGLFVALSGCLCGVIAGYVPYPNFAIWKALDTSKAMVEHLHMTWEDFAEYYCGDQKNNMKGTVITEELKQMKSEAEKLDSYIDSAWYECLGLGKWQRKRLMMKLLSSYMSEVSDRLSAMIQVCLEEDWGYSHSKLMSYINERVAVVIALNGQILSNVLDAIDAAGFTDEGAQSVNGNIDKLLEAVADLTTAFVKGSQAEGFYMVTDEVVGENVVASNVCSFSTLTCEFAKALQEPLPDEVMSWKDGAGPLGVFQPSLLLDVRHVQWAVRNYISIMLAFAIGWYGVAGRMILNYNPAIASTVSVLLSKFVGSALVKNLNRLQGVVLGMIVGQVAYALLGWCTWWGHLSIAFTLFVWELGSLLVYYNSKQYSTVGLLLAVFGATGMLQECSSEIFDPRNSFYAIINCSSAIFVMGVVDVILSPKRASDMARDDYVEIFGPLSEAVKRMCDPEVREVEKLHGQILAQIRAAAALGKEAGQEPRYWRIPWPEAIFDREIEFLATLRFCISSIEFSCTKKEGGVHVKEDHFIAATSLQSFKAVREALLVQMEFIRAQVDKKMRKEDGENVFATRLNVDSELMSTSFEETSLKAMDDFLVEVNATMKSPVPGTRTLEEDPVADMSLFICFLQTIFQELSRVQALIA